MKEFEKEKEGCAADLVEARRLYNDFAEDILIRDIHTLGKMFAGRLKKVGDNWILDEEIIISILTDEYAATLELEDRRGTPYLWVFTVEISGLCASDSFLIDEKRLYSVNLLREGELPNALEEIQKVRNRLQETIDTIKAKGDIANTEYVYVSVKPDVECADIKEVIDKVLDREPIIV